MVLSRPCHPGDQFTTSILRHWCIKHDDLLAEHIKSLLIKNNSLPRKRQRWGASVGPPAAGLADRRGPPQQPPVLCAPSQPCPQPFTGLGRTPSVLGEQSSTAPPPRPGLCPQGPPPSAPASQGVTSPGVHHRWDPAGPRSTRLRWESARLPPPPAPSSAMGLPGNLEPSFILGVN